MTITLIRLVTGYSFDFILPNWENVPAVGEVIELYMGNFGIQVPSDLPFIEQEKRMRMVEKLFQLLPIVRIKIIRKEIFSEDQQIHLYMYKEDSQSSHEKNYDSNDKIIALMRELSENA
ncbi:hypothetical protein [Xanthocytophaga agilis]|uniref:Uncharacterized protein n=1 Tax=Xanthocytophaga agilis TaxID=3048010 RepID=A0AAE3R9R0_9BACT|nr:hypothetical protein [Xanthocytophaga agilis]MDJ1503318.1 hypothetical protein [Xanthocytophaga agilis]